MNDTGTSAKTLRSNIFPAFKYQNVQKDYIKSELNVSSYLIMEEFSKYKRNERKLK